MRHLFMGGMGHGAMGGGMGGFLIGFILHRLIMRLFMIGLVIAAVYFYFRWQAERARNRDMEWRGPPPSGPGPNDTGWR